MKQTVKAYAAMNPKVVIKTNNVRAVGYRVLRKVGSVPLCDEGREMLGVSNLKSYNPQVDKDNFIGQYEPIPHTFELISKPWIAKPEITLTELERQLLESKNTIVTVLENYWLEECMP